MNSKSFLQSPTHRLVAVGIPSVHIHEHSGSIYIVAQESLEKPPERILDRLLHWASMRGEQTFVACRGDDGEWKRISYREMLVRVRNIAAHLLDYDLSPEHPLIILSGNDLEHLQLALASYYIGVPYCPVSPAYSLLAKDFSKLRHIVEHLRPGLVMAAEGAAFSRAIDAVIPDDTPLLVVKGEIPNRTSRYFTTLLEPRILNDADRAFEDTGPDTIAKFLFTSGSTKLPKAVVTTQRMLCANQQMLLQTYPEFALEIPIIVDWLPWNHTFGGSHNIGIALYNGGTFYIDGGRPVEKEFNETLRNLREISPTVYLTIPRGWEELVNALEQDAELRDTFFARVKLFFFAGAGLSQSIWQRLDRVAEQHCGERICMMTGLGMTEAAPSCTLTTRQLSISGYVGLPAPGCEIKLTPIDGKLEARFRGPHIMPGYWRQDELNQKVFDEEGYYRSGDALRFADPQHPECGLMFDGRIAEDFKLNTGVFVSVGPLRSQTILLGAPNIQDIVVVGPDRPCIGLLVFPHLTACRALAGLPDSASVEEILASLPLQKWLRNLIAKLNEDATGLSSYIAWACLVREPPDLDAGEITDKGSFNQRVILERRAKFINALYEGRLLSIRVDS